MKSSKDYSFDNIKELFEDFARLNILVIGDLILDNYIWGDVDRISPEAPVQIISVKRRENRIGGAGNVAANLATLGCKTTIVGACGKDDGYSSLSKLFNSMKINQVINAIPNRPTTVKSRIIAQHQQLLRIDEENRSPVEKSFTMPLFEEINSRKEEFDGVILSDYAKGLLTEDFIKDIISIFKGNVPLIIDPKGYDYSKYRGATAIKPNLKEFCSAVHRPYLRNEEIEEYAMRMAESLDLEGVVITLGEDGVFVLNNKNESHLIPTKAKQVYDVSGAGDTFTAVFTAALILSNDWFLAAKSGNIASGVVISKMGTATASIDEIFNDKNSYLYS
jgi:D-beta-D-heptose 7-phosphate kinase/D-beta-D-heptose 1-phosphate adenosyltransferase